jgi:NAD(P)H dehydrogenase (quinone)
MITVAGGTGSVGAVLTRALVRGGAQVRVLTRDPQKARTTFAGLALEVVGIDFDDSAGLKAAFQGSGSAFLSTGTSDRQVRDELALIDAATGAQVPYLVSLSVGGAGGTVANNVLEWHTQIDAYLADQVGQKTVSTLIRPATYADTIIGLSSGFVKAGAWGGHAGRGLVSLIDTRDVAAVAARILLEGPARHGGRVYDLTGPDAVTMPDIAGLISAAIRSPVDYQDRGEAEQRTVLKSVGVPELLIDVLIGLDDLTRDNLFAQPNSTVTDLTGRPARSVQAWIEEHRSMFTPPATI